METKPREILMPLDVSSRVGFFDRVAGTIARLTSRAPFFAFCVLLVGVWLVQGIVEIIGSGWSSFEGNIDGLAAWSKGRGEVGPPPR